MSKENVIKFEEKVMQDKGLQEKLEAAMKAYSGDKADEKAVFDGVIAPIAKDAGLDFTFDEAAETQKAAKDGEIDLTEMREVAGGVWDGKTPFGSCFIIGGGWGASGGDDDGGGASACAIVGMGFGFWRRV